MSRFTHFSKEFGMSLRRPTLALSLCLSLAACQAPVRPTGSSPGRILPAATLQAVPAKPQAPRLVYRPKPAPYAIIEPVPGAKPGLQTLRVRITYPDPAQGFRTQAFGCGEVAAASIQVTGPGLSTPIYADGADGVTHRIAASDCSLSATLSAVPYGDLVVSIKLYDAEGNFLTGSELKGAVRLSSASQSLELSYRQTVAAQLLERLRQGPIEDRFLAGQIDLPALQSLLDQLMQVGGSFPNYTFSHHPSLINLAALVEDLRDSQGNPASLNPAEPGYLLTARSLRLVLNGYLLTQPVDISLDDALSPNAQANGNGEVVIPNVPPGSWQLRLSGPGYLPRRIAVTVPATAGTDLGPISIYPPQPTLTGLSPSQGVAGSSTVLSGSNFNLTLANNQVKFGTTPATVTAATATSLTVTVPAGLTGPTAPVTVTIGAAAPTASANFALLRPVIDAAVPVAGEIDASIMLSGSHFNPVLANNSVRFGSTAATVTAASATSLTVTVPAGLSGSVDITARNLLSPFSDPLSFAITPTLSTAAPASGSFDELITLTGKGFSSTLNANTVKFGTNSATVTAASNTSLTVKVPDAPAGSRNITVQVGSQTSSAAGFTILPTLSSLSAAATVGGKAALIRGQTLTINGRHFDPTAANNTVFFGAISAPAATVNGAGTQLSVSVPAGVDVPGDVAITVVSNSQTSNALTAAVPGVNVTINGGFK